MCGALIYKCNLCNTEFNKKNHLDNHLNKRKKPCVNNNVIQSTNAEISSTQLHTNSTQTPHNSTQTPHSFSDTELINEVIIVKGRDVNKYKCPYCDLVCSRSDSLNRHIEKYCNN